MLQGKLQIQEIRIYHLYGCCAKLVASTTLRNFREVIDQPFEYVSSIQVTVVVHVDVHHTLGI